MTVVDSGQRAEALDVDKSFCVTAPAGSGKTELLIQRYLALLSRVDRPEQVLAITFTRKAAAEMRERVMSALQAAARNDECEGDHEKVTRALANAALERDGQQGWYLTRDVSRLNIRTIDGFCAGLTRQMPILSRFGGQAQAVDDAALLYREAVGELYKLLDTDRSVAQDLRSLMLHFDNNWDRLTELLVVMLGKRDQWHEYMGARRSPKEAETQLLQTVTAVIEEALEEVSELLDSWQDEIFDLLCYSRSNLEEPIPAHFPGTKVSDMALWRSISELFLTQTGSLRKTVNKRNGFPAGKGEAQDYKDHYLNLVGRLGEQQGLAEELHNLSWLPEMSDNSESWQLVLHLSHVLPMLAACLLVVFERRGSVDHTQVALSALDALGEDDAPTELALRLDYSIEHILVDEFQDTAINQYRLVGKLTRGWGEYNVANPQAPRTIFIVGDGMQSIYGFRNANVGLFLNAREDGFNGVVPHALALQCNFRSDQGVVNWVNQTFRQAFPSEDNVRRGKVKFTDAVAVKDPGDEPAISLNGFYGEHALEQEAHWVVDQLEAALGDGTTGSIAILGRSRPQLGPIISQLRARGLPFASQEMDPLAGSPAIIDLLTLCRALANRADRVAWYALLRAPWCGLSLSDLHLLSIDEGTRGQRNVGALLERKILPEGLSIEGRSALMRLARALDWAQSRRDRLSLRVWVEQVWLMLGGPEALQAPRFLADAGRFFALLQQAEQEGAGLDVDWIQQRLQKLYASGDAPDARIQVMTLHKAKGLEFDRVFIPALARGTRGDSRDILLWDEYNSPQGERGFLLAADDHSDAKAASLYNFLKRQRREKSRLETTRLLYVGATRAVKQLTLSACLLADEDDNGGLAGIKDPGEGALISSIWPVFRSQMTLHEPEQQPGTDLLQTPQLRRIANLPEVNELDPGAGEGGNNIPERANNRTDRVVGTVIHETLENLSLLPELPWQLPDCEARRIQRRLQELGLWGESLGCASARVRASVESTINDNEKGRWILSSSHPQAHSELALSRCRDGVVEDIVIDRTFLDAASGLRWVVDYKSSEPAEGQELISFLDEEARRYSEQLQGYRDAVSHLGAEPVRCALYFTSLALFHHVTALDH